MQEEMLVRVAFSALLRACSLTSVATQGFGKNKDGTQIVKGTNTCHWCKKPKVPKHKKVTYARTVVDVRPEKEDPNRVRITAGGNRLEYYGETPTETASLETAKILICFTACSPLAFKRSCFTKRASSMRG